MLKLTQLLALFSIFLSINCEWYGYVGGYNRNRYRDDGYRYYGNSMNYEGYRRYAIPYYKFNRAYNPDYYSPLSGEYNDYSALKSYDYPYPSGFQAYYDLNGFYY